MKKIIFAILIFCFGCPSATYLKDGGYLMHNQYKMHWNKEDFPIVVMIDQYIDFESKDKFVKAIKEWNLQVAKEDSPALVVQYIDLREPHLKTACGIIIVSIEQIHGEPYNKPENWDGYHVANLKDEGRFCRGRIRIDLDMPLEWRKEIMIHELGHGLGLAHDEENPMSIMYPIVRGLPVPQVIMKDDSDKIKKMMDGSWTQIAE